MYYDLPAGQKLCVWAWCNGHLAPGEQIYSLEDKVADLKKLRDPSGCEWGLQGHVSSILLPGLKLFRHHSEWGSCRRGDCSEKEDPVPLSQTILWRETSILSHWGYSSGWQGALSSGHFTGDINSWVCDGCADHTIISLPGEMVADVAHHLASIADRAGEESVVMEHVDINDMGNYSHVVLEAKCRLQGWMLGPSK